MDKKPEISAVPDSVSFANHMAETFMSEQGVSLESVEDETAIDAIMSIPDLHAEFTLWLTDLVRESAYEDVAAPPNTKLN